jgi:ABC-type transport system substrate-binding protein
LNKKALKTVILFSLVFMLALTATTAIFDATVKAAEEKKYFFEITFIADPGNIDAVEIMKSGWESIGIKVNIVTMEFTTLYARYRFADSFPGATYAEKGYDIALTGWPSPPDPDTTDYYYTEAQIGRSAASQNSMMYSNGEVDKLLEAGVKTTNVAERVKIYQRIEAIIHEELPLLYTYRDPAIKATTANLDLGPARSLPATGLYDYSEQFKFKDKTGGTMVFVGDQNPPSLNNAFTTTTVAVNNIRLVQRRLLKDGLIFGTQEPDLAQKYEISPDGKVYTFHLREDVKWHDGKPFTANDVMFSWNLYMTPEAGFAGSGFWIKYVKSINKVDDYTVQFELYSPYAPALWRFGNSPTILPKHILGDVPPSQLKNHPYNQKPIGTGPFKVVEWKTDEYIKYEAFPDFYLGKPKLDAITFRVIPDKATGIAALEKGEVNLIEQQIYRTSVIQNYDRLKNNNKLEISVAPDNGVNPILINLKHPALGNLYVRKAMASAINIDAIIKGPYKGLGVPTPQRYPKILEPYYDPKITHYTYNIESAKALMEKAGYHYESLITPETPITVYALPAAGGLVVGVIIGVLVDRLIRKKS